MPFQMPLKKMIYTYINNFPKKKLLGKNFDCKVKFNKHIKDIC